MPCYDSFDGCTIHFDDVQRADAAVPLILLAGGAARHPSYLGDLAGLSDQHRLIVPHLRGVGRTRAPSLPERGSWWSQAHDLDHLRIHFRSLLFRKGFPLRAYRARWKRTGVITNRAEPS